jgi:hypothetical protein
LKTHGTVGAKALPAAIPGWPCGFLRSRTKIVMVKVILHLLNYADIVEVPFHATPDSNIFSSRLTLRFAN